MLRGFNNDQPLVVQRTAKPGEAIGARSAAEQTLGSGGYRRPLPRRSRSSARPPLRPPCVWSSGRPRTVTRRSTGSPDATTICRRSADQSVLRFRRPSRSGQQPDPSRSRWRRCGCRDQRDGAESQYCPRGRRRPRCRRRRREQAAARLSFFPAAIPSSMLSCRVSVARRMPQTSSPRVPGQRRAFASSPSATTSILALHPPHRPKESRARRRWTKCRPYPRAPASGARRSA